MCWKVLSPPLSGDCVLLHVVHILHLTDFIPVRQTWYHKRVRYCIQMLEHSTCKTAYKNVLKDFLLWRNVHFRWLNVCLYIFICYYCARRFMHVKNELRWYGSDLLPVGKHLCEFPWECSGEGTNTTAAMLWKYEIFTQPHPNNITCFSPLRWKFGCPPLSLFKNMSVQSVFAWVILNSTAFNSCKSKWWWLL